MNAKEKLAARLSEQELRTAIARWAEETVKYTDEGYTISTPCTGIVGPMASEILELRSALEACQRERDHLLSFMGVEHAGCSYLATRFEPFGWACDKCGRTGAARNLVDAAALGKLQRERDRWKAIAEDLYEATEDCDGACGEEYDADHGETIRPAHAAFRSWRADLAAEAQQARS